MKLLGISVYPEHSSVDEIQKYIRLAAKYNVKRIFSCLLSAEESKTDVIQTFKKMNDLAHEFGMEVIVDVSPAVFDKYDISYDDLSFFAEMGADGLRLDVGFTGSEEARMTYNPQNLKIELNISAGTKYLENILSYYPKLENLIGCHNFYPHKYTGLSYEHFIETSKMFKDNHLRTAAFVNSDHASIGPWPVSEGLCTLEEHRDLSIAAQAKQLWATGLVDDVIIANMFASEDDFKELAKIDPYQLTLGVELAEDITDLDKKIILEEPHLNRGDVSAYMIRSTQSRVKYAGETFPVYRPNAIKRGDILIDSSEYDRYAGELQIALKDMENSGKTNVVGRIKNEEIFLLDYLKPWESFKMKK